MWRINNNNVHIVDSYKIRSRHDMYKILNQIKEQYPNCEVFKRSIYHLSSEWKVHNRLYRLGLFKSHTKDVDLEFPQKWYIKILYYILGI